MKTLMIDYRDENENIVRQTIDDMEFCTRDGEAYFISNREKIHVPFEQIIQMYTT